jgi:hypothetical protein
MVHARGLTAEDLRDRLRTATATVTTVSGYIFTSNTPAYVTRYIVDILVTHVSGGAEALNRLDLTAVEHGTPRPLATNFAVASGQSRYVGGGSLDPLRPAFIIGGSGNISARTLASGQQAVLTVFYYDSELF